MIDLSPVDLLAEQLAGVTTAPVRRPVPADLRQALLHRPLPETATAPDTLLDTLERDLLPYPMGNASPRFFAWVNSPPAPLGVLADFIAAGHNASSAGGDHSAIYMEHAVLNWLKTLLGYPAESAGLLVSGGSVASIVGLAVMRHAMTGGAVRAGGMAALPGVPVVYTSTQGHSCLQKAVELLGIGHDYLRRVPVDDAYRLDVAALRAQIAADRAAGLWPLCVAATAGTVNTGAIDPLEEIAAVCAAEKLWFHVDGAYGGVGILAPSARPLYAGLARADSLAIDPHKWLYVPVECGCIFVRDAAAMRATFSVLPPYLRDDRGLPWFAEFGLQQTRGFKALKLWLTMQAVGAAGYADLIQRDIDLARYLQQQVQAHPDFELVAAGPLSITCFRYAPPGVPPAALDALNQALALRVQQEGEAFLTTTMLHERTVLRACIVNFRTTPADLDRTLAALAAAGQRVLAAQSPDQASR
ncbi:MAG: aminotransferase class V-fold PLP-dependent enzyme [Anaerolineae bacterium]|nr:aminotransferase class V-fold PLP-dependent enzyme [Anaerolineae bacterium]